RLREMPLPEVPIELPQDLGLSRCDLGIAYLITGTQGLQSALEFLAAHQGASGGVFAKLLDRLDIEIKRIVEQTAARRVWASMVGVRGKKGMQGIDADERSTESGDAANQLQKIGEVADAP